MTTANDTTPVKRRYEEHRAAWLDKAMPLRAYCAEHVAHDCYHSEDRKLVCWDCLEIVESLNEADRCGDCQREINSAQGIPR
jgi:hypothetical protein